MPSTFVKPTAISTDIKLKKKREQETHIGFDEMTFCFREDVDDETEPPFGASEKNE